MATEIIESEPDTFEEEPQVVEVPSLSKEIKNALSAKKTVLGLKSIVKELEAGRLAKVITARNMPEKMNKEIKNKAGLSRTPIEAFEGTSTELGIECKRAHTVLVLGIKKE